MKTLDISTVEIEGIDQRDAPRYCDAYVSKAAWTDGVELTETELETLNTEASDAIYECILEAGLDHACIAADYAYDCMKEGG